MTETPSANSRTRTRARRAVIATALLASCSGLIVGTSTTSVAAVADPETSFQAWARGPGASGILGPLESDQGLLSLRDMILSPRSDSTMARKLPRRSRRATLGRNIAVDVVDVESGARIWGRRPAKAMLPASNMKIVTAANILRAYGPDHVFTTRVAAPGAGSVVIRGAGDATLSGSDLEELAVETIDNLRSQGLEPELKPDGSRAWIKVYVDNSLFAAPTSAPGWTGGYQPGIVRPVYPLGLDGSYVWNSSAEAAAIFASYLNKHGYGAKYLGEALATGTEVADHDSLPLTDQVKYMLQVSENNVAEMLYRLVAVARHRPATWAGSRQAALESLAELGVPISRLGLFDGSGVSRADRLTARSLTALLRVIADPNRDSKLYSIHHGGGMPLAGRTGTLASSLGRFSTRPSSCARGLIRAKTGTLYDTVALSGLTVGADGRLKAFSIMVNDRPYRRYSPLQTRRSVDAVAATVTGCW